MIIDITKQFCNIDDFCGEFMNNFIKRLIESKDKKRNRSAQLSVSEIITIIILFHQKGYRNFKTFYKEYVCVYLKNAFPGLVSYERFVALMPTILIPLCAYLQSLRGKCTGISYIDATTIKVCHNMRINSNKVFAGVAKRGKSTMGWFYGFKLHLVINDHGEILNFCVTPGNTGDRAPVTKLTNRLIGKLFGDRGYISKQLFTELFENGLQLITTVRKNMKNQFIPIIDKILLRKRFIIETVNDQLKNISQIEHSRHRSMTNFMVNLLAGIAAYIFQPKKPSIKFHDKNYNKNSLEQLNLLEQSILC